MSTTASEAAPQSAGPVEAPAKRRRSRAAMLTGQVAVALALLSGAATFLILTGLTPISPTHNVVVTVTLINLVFVLFLSTLIAREGWDIWQARRERRAGSRLHVQIIALFCLVAAIPAIMMAVIASITLDRGLDRWFSDRTRLIVENSLTVARAYVREHGQVIRSDLIAMASDINNAADAAADDFERFRQYFDSQAILRALPGAYLIHRDGSVWLAARTGRSLDYLEPPGNAVERADTESVIYATEENRDVVSAIIRLKRFDDLYLVVSRALDPTVLTFLRQTEAGVAEYISLEERRLGVQLAFGFMYLGLSLILILSATWVGIGFADKLVSPIRRLIGAADRVSEGDLEVVVPVDEKAGDVGALGRTFNNMTRQLRTQRDALLTANKMLDRRRRFTEAVLSGVTAGVIGVDREGQVTLVNRTALAMIGLGQPKIIGKPLAEEVPELAALVADARESTSRFTQGQINLVRDGNERTISVRVAAEQSGQAEQGFVVTLDDITELLTAQRGAAWADIARRIAHEIKNPLTPIQLSAERLKRKYGRTIEMDRDIFDQCTDTIIRQVGDIGRMVDEFSSFARMPKPTMEPVDIAEIVRETVFMMRVGHPNVAIEYEPPETPRVSLVDRRLVSQALTNIIKNASESVEARMQTDPSIPGNIEVSVLQHGGRIAVDVTDNGVGLPAENRAKLLEPYITRREKGTGLGLAIVRKIMEDHGGGIELLDSPNGTPTAPGARIRLSLPAIAGTAAPRSESQKESAHGG